MAQEVHFSCKTWQTAPGELRTNTDWARIRAAEGSFPTDRHMTLFSVPPDNQRRFREPADSEQVMDVNQLATRTRGSARSRIPLRSLPWSFAITVYGFALLVLIVLYYILIALAIIAILDLEGRLVRNLWPPQGLWFVRINLACLLLFVLTRLTLHLWRGMAGLVTQQHDSVPDSATGTLLLPEQYPALYDAVSDVGREVQSPKPDEIRLTFRPDCYVVELRSFSIRTDRRLVLVIGLPHLEVLTLNELKVIVAHELAHFGSGDTRLGVFVFRFLESLRQARKENEDTGWRWIDPVAWLSWTYFHLFLVLSAPIRKHQELRADSWSAMVYGGHFAAQTLLKDWLLERQFNETLTRFLHTIPRKAGGNVFREFAEHFHDLTPTGQAYLEDRLAEEERPAFWDSHPTIHERMTNMRRFPDKDLPEAVPCHFLLPEFEQLEKKMQDQLDAQQPAFPPSDSR